MLCIEHRARAPLPESQAARCDSTAQPVLLPQCQLFCDRTCMFLLAGRLQSGTEFLDKAFGLLFAVLSCSWWIVRRLGVVVGRRDQLGGAGLVENMVLDQVRVEAREQAAAH